MPLSHFAIQETGEVYIYTYLQLLEDIKHQSSSKEQEMAAVVALIISLAAVLQQSTGQRPDFASLSTENAGQQKEIINKHNNLRRNVSPPASNMLKMDWNSAATENSDNWARKCTLSHSPPEKRTINGKACGENLFMSTAPTSWSEAIQAWYDEEKDFKYGYGSITGAVTGHYTQLVWYRSNLLGCSVAYCPWRKFAYYYVCHYCPGGNIVGSINKPYKLGKPCADCPNACDNKLCTNPCKYSDDYSNCPQLKRSHGCGHADVKKWCKATCLCETEIK